MNSLFDPVKGPIILTAELEGPSGVSLLRLLLDFLRGLRQPIDFRTGRLAFEC